MVEERVIETIEENGVDLSEEEITAVDQLVARGREHGFINAEDVVELMPEASQDENLLGDTLAALAEVGIPFQHDDDDDEEDEVEEHDEVAAAYRAPRRKRKATSTSSVLEEISTEDMVGLYIKEAAQVPLLTAEEEVEIAQRIERGRLAQQELGRGNVSTRRLQELRRLIEDGGEARERLIQANARLVISVAKKYIGRGVPFLDLIQEGNIGLMRAIKKYDYERGYKFSTYATWWIRQAITRALADQSRTIRLPVHMSDSINRMLREQNRLQQTMGRPPSREELAEALGVPPDKVEHMMQVVRQPVSLQAPVGEDDDEALGDFIQDFTSADPEDTAIQTLMGEDLKKALEKLPPRELQVLQLRYGLGGEAPQTLREVGRRMGITRERARQLEAQAFRRLRNPSDERALQAYTE